MEGILVDIGQTLHNCFTKWFVILANGFKHFSAASQTSRDVNKNVEKGLKKLICGEMLRVAILFHLLTILHIFHDRLKRTQRRVRLPIKELIDKMKVPRSFR